MAYLIQTLFVEPSPRYYDYVNSPLKNTVSTLKKSVATQGLGVGSEELLPGQLRSPLGWWDVGATQNRRSSIWTWRRSASTLAWSLAWSRWLVAIASRRIRRIEYSVTASTARDITGSWPAVRIQDQALGFEPDALSAPHSGHEIGSGPGVSFQLTIRIENPCAVNVDLTHKRTTAPLEQRPG
jgi:hypothetical protein